MKKLLASLAILAAISVTSQAADGTVSLNNYDSNNPIFYLNTSTRLPVAGALVQVLGGPVGGALTAIGANIPLAEPGFFDGGFGVVAGVAESGQASLQVRAWKGAAGSTFASAAESGSTPVFSQAIGTNPPLPNTPSPAALNMPSFEVKPIPEPSTVILGLLGAAALLIRRRK